MQLPAGKACRSLRIAAGLMYLLAFDASVAGAGTYYVRTSGNDTSDGLTPQTAFASVRHAGRLLLEPGDRVVVGPGLYAEGNIEPFGSGSRDMPIIFEGDSTGQRTGDPPGPVIVKPPNSEDATTGFIIFGKHDVRITGFAVDGANDAGIQVRANFSTGVDSTRIMIDTNTITNTVYRGISITATGDVEVANNTVADSGLTGLSLFSGRSTTPLRPSIHDNVFERNGVGIGAEKTRGGTIEDNIIGSNLRGVVVEMAEELSFHRNQVAATAAGAMSIRSSDLNFTDNVVEVGDKDSEIAVTGNSSLRRNRFVNDRPFGVDLSLFAEGSVEVAENDLPRSILVGSADLVLDRNHGDYLAASGSTITAITNEWRFTTELNGSGAVQVTNNEVQAGAFTVSGRSVAIEGNNLQTTRVTARFVTIHGNAIRTLFLEREAPVSADDTGADSFFRVEENTVEFDVVVNEGRALAATAFARAVVERNRVTGAMYVTANDDVLLRNNAASGIFCQVIKPDSTVTVVNNRARGHRAAGIIVRGARRGVIEGNESSQNMGSGFAIRRSANLMVAGNSATANRLGGFSVDVGSAVAGDCNNDDEVTVEEIIRAVDIVLGNRSLRDCVAIDESGDETATVDELVLAVDVALNGRPQQPGVVEGDLVIDDNRIEDNGGYGIDMFVAGPIVVSDNRILRNGGIGVTAQLNGPAQVVDVVGNRIGSNLAEGILLSGTTAAQVRDNLIFSNAQGGILLRNTPGVSVINNLVYDNGNDAIAVGVGTPLASPDAVLMNNTLYANAGWGVTIGSPEAASTGTAVVNNIIDGNQRGGIAANPASLPGSEIGFNLNNDGYGHGVVPSVTDFVADPRFVDSNGVDNILGEHGPDDDDFHLFTDSPAIDAGSARAVVLGITGSAIEGHDTDEGIVDLGFHYNGASPEVD